MSSIISNIRNIIAFIRTYTLCSNIIITSIGTIGNILNILMFSNSKLFRGNICSFYFNIESIVNITILIFTLISQTITIIDNNSIWCKIRSMLIQILAPFSLLLVCYTSIDQFFSTSPIPFIRQQSSPRSSRINTIVTLCICILHSIPSGIFTDSYMRIACYSSNDIYLRYQLYFYYPILLGILPMSISSIFSLLAYRNVRRIVRRQVPLVRRRLDQQMTALVFVRVILLVVLYLPYVVYYMYWSTASFDRTNYLSIINTFLAGTIINSLVLVNHAMTFYVLLIVSPRYRRQLKYLFIKRFWRRCKQICQRKHNQVNPLRDTSVDGGTDFD